MTRLSEKKWESLRQQLHWNPDIVYLNSGSASLIPETVFRKLIDIRSRLCKNPNEFIWGSSYPLIEESREVLARRLHVSPRELLLFINSTFANSTILESLRLTSEDEVIITDQEYHHFLAHWKRKFKETGVAVKTIHLPLPREDPRLSPGKIVRLFDEHITSKTKLMYFSHITSSLGLVLPAKELCGLAKSRNILSIIDGAHAPGMIPVDLNAIDADFYFGNVHKWLMGAIGSAFLHVPKRSRPFLGPLVTTAAWDFPEDRPDEASARGSTNWIGSFEYQGTQDKAPLIVIKDSLEFLNGIGFENIAERVRRLTSITVRKITAAGFEPASFSTPELSCGMFSFFCPRVDPGKAADWLRHHKSLELGFTALGTETIFRVSHGWYNTEHEIDYLVRCLEEMPWRMLGG